MNSLQSLKLSNSTHAVLLRFHLHLQLHSIRKFVARNTRLQPAYFIAVDHAQQTIIWGGHVVSCVITVM
jgi:hypothetical protein